MQKNIVSVSQLNKKAKQVLQTQLGMIWVRGEISGLSRPASGHWYFTLKDSSAQISCAMFKGRNALLRKTPKDGDQVVVRGNISLYEPRGNYQLIAEHIEAEGEGLLRQSFEALKEKLNNEGLFANEHKQALPSFPKHIAVISSATGAAVHDMITVLKRRWPICEISIFPCLVQGQEAPREICHALKQANAFTDSNHPLEAIILGRGGGSLEDLQAFNEESVARAVFNSKLPVISAVGHEIDFSICDFIADYRAPTPSAAAEIICPHQQDIIQTLDHIENKLSKEIGLYISTQKAQVTQLKNSMWHPKEKIAFYQERFNQYLKQFKQTINTYTQNATQTLSTHNDRLALQTPSTQEQSQRLNSVFQDLTQALNKKVSLSQQQFSAQANLLNTVSPLATLKRGYAIASSDDGEIAYQAETFKKGDSINITLSEGRLSASVHTVKKH